jgi:transcriptional regulator with XRE-family HTH domain
MIWLGHDPPDHDKPLHLGVIRRWRFRQGMPILEIERRTGLLRNTSRKYLRANTVERKRGLSKLQGHLGVKRVGFGELASSSGKVPDVTRVDDADRDAVSVKAVSVFW